MTFSELLANLTEVKREGGSYVARCPSHADGNPSLLLTLEPSGRLLIFCRAGCQTPSIVRALGLTMADLFDMKPGEDTVTATVGPKAAPSHAHLEAIDTYCSTANDAYRGSPAATYAYERFGIEENLGYYIGLGYDPGDGEFEFLTTVYRRAPRLVVPFADFNGLIQGLQGRALVDDPTKWCGPRNPDGHAWATLGVTDLDGDEKNVLITEGPGDRLTAVGAGYSAIGIRGAALARNSDTVAVLSANLHGRRIVLCGDNDESGIDFNLSLGGALAGHGHQVHTLSIPVGNDLSDWRADDPDGFATALRHGLRSATRIDANMAPTGPPPDDDDDGFDVADFPTDYLPMTDEGNAHRLLALTGGLARWCPEMGWLLYSEGAWGRDISKQIRNALRKTLRKERLVARQRDLARHARVEQRFEPCRQCLGGFLEQCLVHPAPRVVDAADRWRARESHRAAAYRGRLIAYFGLSARVLLSPSGDRSGERGHSRGIDPCPRQLVGKRVTEHDLAPPALTLLNRNFGAFGRLQDDGAIASRGISKRRIA